MSIAVSTIAGDNEPVETLSPDDTASEQPPWSTEDLTDEELMWLGRS
jgi:hypothetical protein